MLCTCPAHFYDHFTFPLALSLKPAKGPIVSCVSRVALHREEEIADPVAWAKAAPPLISQCSVVANLYSKAGPLPHLRLLCLLELLNQFYGSLCLSSSSLCAFSSSGRMRLSQPRFRLFCKSPYNPLYSAGSTKTMLTIEDNLTKHSSFIALLRVECGITIFTILSSRTSSRR